MGLREIEATLPPGFRFCPSDGELICHYLHKKIENGKLSNGIFMAEVNLHLCEPWQLPEVAKVGANEWYFFSFRDRKYATGFRSNRATLNGFWKATGKDRPVFYPNNANSIVGMRKTLVYYFGRAPNGMKTGWVMHEFRLENLHLPPKEDWVLSRVFHKGKEQVNNKNDLEDDLMSAAIGATSHMDKTMQIEYQHFSNQDNHPSTWSHSFLDQDQEDQLNDATVPMNETSSSGAGGHEFLFDLYRKYT